MIDRPKATLARSIQYLFQRYVLQRRYLDVDLPAMGLKLRVNAADAMGRSLWKRGTHEPELTHFVQHHAQVRPGRVFLDIGANLGWYSCLVSKRFPEARIHAYEPEPQNHDLLLENLRRNRCANVTPHQLAVSETSGEQQFYPHADKNLGRHSLLPINDLPPIAVRCVRLDEHLASLGVAPEDVDLVKIDIEGYELPALRGAPRLLAARPLILAEYAPKYMNQGGLDPADYLRLLTDAGFVPFAHDGEALRPVDLDELRATTKRHDLVWRKPGP
jgi:FkbM family methyltransferase